LKEKIEVLKAEKENIEKLLENERKECGSLSKECENLHERKQIHMEKIKILQAALQAKDVHLKELETKIEEVEAIIEKKTATIETLSTKLENKEQEYQESQEKLLELARTLSLRRVELREKSTVVQALESSLLRGNRNLDVEKDAVKRTVDQEGRLAQVKKNSLRDYHVELEVPSISLTLCGVYNSLWFLHVSKSESLVEV